MKESTRKIWMVWLLFVILILLLIAAIGKSVYGQIINFTPITTGNPSNHVSIGIEFTGLTNVGAYSLKIKYDPNKLHLDTLISNDSNGGFVYNAYSDTIAICWFSSGINPLNTSIPDSLCFTIIKTGCSALTYLYSTCDVADIMGQCYTVSYQNTTICYAVTGVYKTHRNAQQGEYWWKYYDTAGRRIK
jgi:hypothetical protein